MNQLFRYIYNRDLINGKINLDIFELNQILSQVHILPEFLLNNLYVLRSGSNQYKQSGLNFRLYYILCNFNATNYQPILVNL